MYAQAPGAHHHWVPSGDEDACHLAVLAQVGHEGVNAVAASFSSGYQRTVPSESKYAQYAWHVCMLGKRTDVSELMCSPGRGAFVQHGDVELKVGPREAGSVPS